MDFSNKNAIIKKQLINKNNMVVSPKMPGFQWDPNILKQAQAKIEEDAKLSASLRNLNKQPRESGLPPSMVERNLRETPVHRGHDVIIIQANAQEVPEIPKPAEKLSGQKAPVMVSEKGNSAVPAGYTDKTTQAMIDTTLPKTAAHPVMHQAPPKTPPEPRHPVQIGMKPPVPPQQI